MDFTRWELWRTADGVWRAIRLGTNGKVRIEASSAQERADKIDAWEAEHAKDTGE